MEQNSHKWLEWRRKGIGASDAPVIMGVSPWNTPYKLWEEKMGHKKSQGNFATQRGHNLEPKARAAFELAMDDDFPAVLATSDRLPWLRASLDGFNKDKNSLLEIKCPGKDDHQTAKDGKIPEKYIPQLQHQFLVTGADICYYYSYDGESGIVVEVKPDIAYINDKLLPALEQFWGFMQSKTPPPLCDRDQVKVEDEKLITLANQYALLDDQAKVLKASMDDIKKELVSHLDHPKSKVGRLAVTMSIVSGAVDYKAVPELEGVDTEQYRKDSFEKVTIRVGKK